MGSRQTHPGASRKEAPPLLSHPHYSTEVDESALLKRVNTAIIGPCQALKSDREQEKREKGRNARAVMRNSLKSGERLNVAIA